MRYQAAGNPLLYESEAVWIKFDCRENVSFKIIGCRSRVVHLLATFLISFRHSRSVTSGGAIRLIMDVVKSPCSANLLVNAA